MWPTGFGNIGIFFLGPKKVAPVIRQSVPVKSGGGGGGVRNDVRLVSVPFQNKAKLRQLRQKERRPAKLP